MSLFGNTQPSSGSSLFGSSQPQQSNSLFGSSTPKPGGSSLFGSTQPSGGGLFGNTSNQSSGGGLFGNTSSQPSGGGLFGNTSNQQSGGGLFGNAGNTQQQGGGGLFGSNTQSSGGGFFGSSTQPQTGGGLFGSSTQQNQGGGLFGGSTAQQQPLGSTLGAGQAQQSQLGQTLGQPSATGSAIWTPGQGMTGVHRTVPMQIMIVKDKWDPRSRTSPFRSHLYNNVGEDQAPFFQPGPNDDETKWEEALRKRPGPSYVPVLVQGFWELGKRAQKQKDFLTMMQTRLHEINNALTELLSRHDLKISVRISASRRKHLVLSQRCLALAAKTQVLRNRGYAMDESELELAKKLGDLERCIFDPSINGRVEEIWARMLAILERSKHLKQELELHGIEKEREQDDGLDEAALKTAKKILDDYAKQIQHLDNELAVATKELEGFQRHS